MGIYPLSKKQKPSECFHFQLSAGHLLLPFTGTLAIIEQETFQEDGRFKAEVEFVGSWSVYPYFKRGLLCFIVLRGVGLFALKYNPCVEQSVSKRGGEDMY